MLAQSVQEHGKGGNVDTLIFQALTAQKRDRHQQAATLRARVEAWWAGYTPSSWQERVMWEALLAEARRLIPTGASKPRVGSEQ